MPLSRFKLAKTDRVREAIRTTVEAGGSINRELWAERLAVSVGTVQRAELQVRAYLDGRNGYAGGALRRQPAAGRRRSSISKEWSAFMC